MYTLPENTTDTALYIRTSNELCRAPNFFSSKVQVNLFYYLLTNVKEMEDGSIQSRLNIKKICRFYEGNLKGISEYRKALDYIRYNSDVTMAIPNFRLDNADVQKTDASSPVNIETYRKNSSYTVYTGSLIIGYEYTQDADGNEGDDFVVDFNPRFKPALINISSRYATMFLSGLKCLPSKNASRMYVYLVSWLDNKNNETVRGEWKLFNDDPASPGIRQVLNLVHKYSRKSDFLKVVEQSLQEINEKSDLDILDWRLSPEKDSYFITFKKDSRQFAIGKNRLSPVEKADRIDTLCWKAVELINLLIGKNYLYSSHTTASQIKKRINSGYKSSMVLDAVLKQFAHFQSSEPGEIRTYMSPQRIYPVIKKNQPDYFDIICQYNQPSLIEILDIYCSLQGKRTICLYEYEAIFYGIYLCLYGFPKEWLAHASEDDDQFMKQIYSIVGNEYGDSLIGYIREIIGRPVAKSENGMPVDMGSVDYHILKMVVSVFGTNVVFNVLDLAAADNRCQMLYVVGLLFLLQKHGLVDEFKKPSSDCFAYLKDNTDNFYFNNLDNLKHYLNRFQSEQWFDQ